MGVSTKNLYFQKNWNGGQFEDREHVENTYSMLKLFVPQSENLSMVDRGKVYLKEIK